LEAEIIVDSLPIEGWIPMWLEGTLLRNGPAKWDVGKLRISHWFDGLAMLHAFSFRDGKVSYANKFIRSQAYDDVMNHHRLPSNSFASDPCSSIFQKLLTMFLPSCHLEIQNANVNIAKFAEKYVAMTETPLPVEFDPLTLETLGVHDYKDKLPKRNSW